MNSAGNIAPYGTSPTTQGYPQQQSGPTLQPYQPLPVSTYQPSNMQLNGTMSQPAADRAADANIGMQAVAAANNILNSVLNYALSSEWMKSQTQIATKYYQTQDNIASYQQNVALKQLGVAEDAIYVQQQMHSEQTRHEEAMARIEGATQRRIAQVAEDGKTERANIIAASDAFKRSGYDNYGLPIFSA